MSANFVLRTCACLHAQSHVEKIFWEKEVWIIYNSVNKKALVILTLEFFPECKVRTANSVPPEALTSNFSVH